MKKLIFIFLLIGTPRLWSGDCPPPSSCDAFEYAQYAGKVYSDNSEGEPFDLDCSDDRFLPSVYNAGDGLYLEVFYNKEKNEYIIAFRGTQEGQDWLDDFDQGLNGHNEQFERAKGYFKLINKALNKCAGDAKRTITGHSLGGALAQFVGENAGANYTVVTFNPAGLLPSNRPHPPDKPYCIFNYIHGNDVLYTFVNPLLAEMARAEGNSSANDKIAAGYIGTDEVLGEDNANNFANMFQAGDIEAFRDILAKIKKAQECGWKLSKVDIAALSESLSKLGGNQSLSAVWGELDSELGEKWKDLLDAANETSHLVPTILPPYFKQIDGPDPLKVASKLAGFGKRLLWDVMRSRVKAHLLGGVTNKKEIQKWEKSKKEWDKQNAAWQQRSSLAFFLPPPDPLPPCPTPKYDSDSLLGMLQEKCNDDTLGGSGGGIGGGSPGTTPGSGTGSGIVTPPTGSPGIISISPGSSSGGQNSSGGTIGDGDWGSCTPGEGYKKGTYQKMLYNK